MTAPTPESPPAREPGPALITGGSSGIGLAIALRLAASGRHVAIAARDPGKLDAAATRLADASPPGTPDPVAIRADLATPAGGADAVADALGRLGSLAVLVNNAGWAATVPIAESTPERAAAAFAVNVFAPIEAIRAALPALTSAADPCIVNVSSWAARDPFPGFFIYAATKAALNSLTRSIHNEYGERGVRAFGIGPGAVETPLLRASFATDVLPPEQCLAADEVAGLVIECIEGRRDDDVGRTLYIRRGERDHTEITAGV